MVERQTPPCLQGQTSLTFLGSGGGGETGVEGARSAGVVVKLSDPARATAGREEEVFGGREATSGKVTWTGASFEDTPSSASTNSSQ